MKNLKAICPPKELKRVLNAMKRKKVIFMHKDGDIYTHRRWIFMSWEHTIKKEDAKFPKYKSRTS